MNQKFISVIVPAFNEEENVSVLINRLHDVLRHEGPYEIVVVDDGSTDNTLFVVQQLSEDNPAVRYLSFSRNYGHQMALRAGYDHARGDCVISLDADLQHPPEFIPILLDHWRRGFEVVHTIRQTDPHLSWFKRASSRWFYRLLRSVSNLDLADGTADFCLLDRKVVDSLKQFKETDLFLRGIVSWIGFRQCRVVYKPAERYAGVSKYSVRKMLQLAGAGITSFSTKPLYISVVLGFFMSLAAGLFGLEVLYEKYFTQHTVSGWTSIVLLVVLIGGFQFMMMGVIGIYLGKMFQEVKQRPSYIVRETEESRELMPHQW